MSKAAQYETLRREDFARFNDVNVPAVGVSNKGTTGFQSSQLSHGFVIPQLPSLAEQEVDDGEDEGNAISGVLEGNMKLQPGEIDILYSFFTSIIIT
jgi:hypothetical protein